MEWGCALDQAVDLLIVNKFGKLEGQGGGLAHEMVAAAAAGIPVLTTIREDRLDRWADLMGDMAVILPPERGRRLPYPRPRFLLRSLQPA